MNFREKYSGQIPPGNKLSIVADAIIEITQKDARIAELETERPKFAVGEDVEFEIVNTGAWHKGQIGSARMHYVSSDKFGTCLIAEDRIRKSQSELSAEEKLKKMAAELMQSGIPGYAEQIVNKYVPPKGVGE